MDLPIAPVTATNVNRAIILDENTDNVIHINIEAKQIINQTAFLEVSQVPDPDIQPGGNYDNDTLRMNFSILTPISSPITTNNISRSLTLPSRTIEVYDGGPTPDSRRDSLRRDRRNRRYPNGRNDSEGKMFVAFMFIVVLIIIVFVKID